MNKFTSIKSNRGPVFRYELCIGSFVYHSNEFETIRERDEYANKFEVELIRKYPDVEIIKH